jgi:hypothetical protein
LSAALLPYCPEAAAPLKAAVSLALCNARGSIGDGVTAAMAALETKRRLLTASRDHAFDGFVIGDSLGDHVLDL